MTRLTTIPVFLLIAIFIGCKDKPVRSRALNDEYAVINLALKNGIVSDELFKKSFTEDPYTQFADSLTESQRERNERYYDSLQRYYDTVTPSLYIKDTLYRFPKERLIDYTDPTKQTSSTRKLKNARVVSQIAFSVVDSSTIVSKLDIKQIDPVHNYHLFFFRKHEFVPEVMLYKGTVRLSKPCFNSKKTMACISLQLKCGDPCGYLKLLFFRKVHNHWEMVLDDMVAVY